MKDPRLPYLLLSLLFLPCMITSESLWVDETSTGLFARQPDFVTWWQYLQGNISSDGLMPLSMFFAWVGGQVIGSGEWQLRALNLLWGAGTLAGAAVAGRRLGVRWLPLLVAIQPYFWFYTSEARPYALQICAGAWLLVGVVDFMENRGAKWSGALIFTAAALVLCYATMLAPMTLAAMVAPVVVIAVHDRWRIDSRFWWIFGAGAALAIPAAWHYLFMLGKGAKGAELWQVDAKYLAYMAYEWMGLNGLGPATAELREVARSSGLKALLTGHRLEMATVAACAGALGFFVVCGATAWRGSARRRTIGVLLAIVLFGGFGFFAASLATHKAFWARHLAPIFPFYAALLALIITESARILRPWIFRTLLAVLATLLLCSSLSFRFAARHRKENYRAAAHAAQTALSQGRSVWWIAAPEGADYYGVPLTLTGREAGRAFCPLVHTGRPQGDEVSGNPLQLPTPDFLILSRPEAFDASGAVRSVIQNRSYHPAGSAPGMEFYAR